MSVYSYPALILEGTLLGASGLVLIMTLYQLSNIYLEAIDYKAWLFLQNQSV